MAISLEDQLASTGTVKPLAGYLLQSPPFSMPTQSAAEALVVEVGHGLEHWPRRWHGQQPKDGGEGAGQGRTVVDGVDDQVCSGRKSLREEESLFKEMAARPHVTGGRVRRRVAVRSDWWDGARARSSTASTIKCAVVASR